MHLSPRQNFFFEIDKALLPPVAKKEKAAN
jgi:hypothetical protein